ncbi:hypothetical protein [Clostridium saccharobutylicum]|uniref:Lipoprotein n=1 Tax=Clostridium saccharobutylicum DSM 13864 TaxID=1345695 RepID=U5MLH7_CLOSA|nr:hypothetical protein [Clostridium saccharobutylicum]AGX41664.1 hypothetical protein CLSA_c06510 [Clostridium saccharobutylicum DSM 13864]AQR88947.1 hypothetical protein CLOSC_06430 [Clostridium saccharobutylicum]AQR98848.1 hypothetical protein CSACC_06500 [Clostridium saccharobutylicum]AQS08566.1 hypothetical protein CLOBY_06760 [Clostridium saccharobutylicum]AQS12836.1 hypothetical protein CLOSACC_06500 [Clostridium saccharobutylicum]
MSKKIISIMMSLLIATSLIGCGKTNDASQDKSKTNTEDNINIDEKDKDLQGSWAKNYTLDQTKKLYNEKLAKIEGITKDFGLKYSKGEKIKEENGVSINDNSIYFDNEKPEKNKIESMYFGMKTYGEDLAYGDISLKLSLNFDGEGAIKNNNFDLGKTSFAKYIAAFTGQENRDYSQINKEIIQKLKNGDNDIKLDNTIDGLKEEILVTKECIIYNLSTKKYKFADADMSMK